MSALLDTMARVINIVILVTGRQDGTPAADEVQRRTGVSLCWPWPRFPGAPTLGLCWDNVRAGVESVHVFTDDELLAAGETPSRLATRTAYQLMIRHERLAVLFDLNSPGYCLHIRTSVVLALGRSVGTTAAG